MQLAFLLLSCQETKQWVSEQYTPSYSVAEAQESVSSRMGIVRVASGVEQPTDVRFPEPNVMVVTGKKGTIWRYVREADGSFRFANIMAQVSVRDRSELGLLSLAFHPEYKKNGRLYLYSTPLDGDRRSELSEWKIRDAEQWTIEPVRTLLSISQPYGNHNGGQIQFGPDGMLYLSLGDGGWRDDPHGNGQNTSTLLGTIIRIQPTPDQETSYQVPSDNPFVGSKTIDERIYVYGLRNPWRFSFVDDGRVIVADVGQNLYEEVSLAQAGENLGWNVFEGKHCFQKDDCTLTSHRAPIWEYGHEQGTSITGGYVQQSEGMYKGSYIVGDFTSGRIWALHMEGKATELGVFPVLLSTFGRNANGEIFFADFAKGDIYQLREATFE